MDNGQGAQGISGHCPVRPDFVQGISGQSTESMDIVQSEWAPWTCPEYPWTLSRLSTDSIDNVQGVHGHCPGNPWIQWTFYRRVEGLYKGADQLRCYHTADLHLCLCICKKQVFSCGSSPGQHKTQMLTRLYV